ncbi:MAG TPA: penicillin-binding protein 2 [Acidimicrobiia bacterium]|nr:penicillin-binding protein 2 [Acidimicrobiia bacterium]
MSGRSRARRRLRRADFRLITVGVVLIVAWSGLGFRLFQIQVVDAAVYEERSREQRTIHQDLAAARGTIFDRQGQLLAVTIEGVTVSANLAEIDDFTVTASLIAAAVGGDRDELKARLESKETGWVTLVRQMEPADADHLRELELPGLYFVNEPKRVYPAGRFTASVVGFVGWDNEGLEGMEYFYESALAGTPGYAEWERAIGGTPIPFATSEIVPAVPGSDLVSTIDLDIQFAASQACVATIERTEALRCTIVVLDPNTGEVLAMVNTPSFDPNDVRSADPAMLQNAAVRMTYEPGSTQKLVTVAAAIEEKAVQWSTLIRNVPYELEVIDGACDKGDEVYGCYHDVYVHPDLDMTVKDIFTRSSNTGTILIQRELGDVAHRKYLEKWGFGSRTGIDFSGEAAGVAEVDITCGPCTASAAIGYSVSVTPLQMASVFATIANDGVWVRPHLVGSIVDGDGIRQAVEPEQRRIVSEETARIMRLLLRSVVESDDGTGGNARVTGYEVGGKTGTSRKWEGGGYSETAWIASFIGMAPIDDPQLVVAVVIDSPVNGHYGGDAAAPAFAEVMENALHQLGVSPDE